MKVRRREGIASKYSQNGSFIGTGELSCYCFIGTTTSKTVHRVFPVFNTSGELQASGGSYGLVKYPIGITANTTKADFDQLLQRQLYFNNTISSSPGRYAPCTVRVIPPDDVATRLGDVYDRYYAHETPINRTGVALAAGDWTASYDKSTLFKSIRDVANKNTHFQLIRASASPTAAYRTNVPLEMRQGIEKLFLEQLHLDDTYFTNTLLQLKSFLLQVDSELKQSLNKGDIANLCIVKYNIAAKFD